MLGQVDNDEIPCQKSVDVRLGRRRRVGCFYSMGWFLQQGQEDAREPKEPSIQEYALSSHIEVPNIIRGRFLKYASRCHLGYSQGIP